MGLQIETAKQTMTLCAVERGVPASQGGDCQTLHVRLTCAPLSGRQDASGTCDLCCRDLTAGDRGRTRVCQAGKAGPCPGKERRGAQRRETVGTLRAHFRLYFVPPAKRAALFQY